MQGIQPEDNVVVITDGINYDNFAATAIALANLSNLVAICSTNGWSTVGYSIEPINNLILAVLRWRGVKFFAGSVSSRPDQLYRTTGLFNNFIDPEENSQIDNMFGGRSIVTNIVNSYRELIDDSVSIVSMSEPDGDKYDFYAYARQLPNLVVVSLGPMTDVVPIVDNIKILVQQGGRFYNDYRPIELPRVNPTASSNIYLDPVSAREVLHSIGDRIYWVMSETVIPVLTDDETAAMLRSLSTNNPLYNMFLRALTIYYQGMSDMGYILALTDVTAILAAMYPQLVTKVEQKYVDIVDDFKLRYFESDTEIISQVRYDKRIGSMVEGSQLTNLVTGIDDTAMKKLFYKAIAPEFLDIEYSPKVQSCITSLSDVLPSRD